VEKNDVLPQTGTERRRSIGGTLANALVAGHLFLVKERRLGFLGLEEEEGKESSGQ